MWVNFMNILMCINDNYIYPLINLMYSIKKYNKEKIDLYIFSTGLKKTNIDVLKKTLSHLDISINIKLIDQTQFTFYGKAHYSVDMFLRIIAFKYLPNNLHKILYLDADMLAVGDIGKIYNYDLDGKLIGVVDDFICLKNNYNDEYVKSLNIDHPYFNSGMLLFNLNGIRESWDYNIITEFIVKNINKYNYPDQDMLNILIKKDEVCLLNKAFNYQLRCREKMPDNKDIILVHYVGDKKPWNHLRLSKHEKLFWKNYKDVNDKEFREISKKMKIERLKKLPVLFLKKIFKL